MSLKPLLTLGLFAQFLPCQTVTVGPAGSGAPFTSVQQGISFCPQGGTVLVLPGLYPEVIDFGGRAIRVVSQVPHQAILDATTVQPPVGAPVPVVRFVTGEGRNSILEGFVVTGGASLQGGGVRCLGTSPTLRNNRILGNGVFQNVTWGPGGGVYVANGSPWLDGNLIQSNQGTLGGGVYCSVGGVLMTDTVVSNNTALADGGGLYADGLGKHTITRSTFLGNNGQRGGGIALLGILGLEVTDSHLLANIANGSGGGIALLSTSSRDLRVTSSQFTDNIANVDGGGMHCVSASPTLQSCTFTHNFADRFGGGLHLFERSSATVSACSFVSGNTAWQSGGGIAVRNGADAATSSTTVSASMANQKGGGIFVSDATLSMRGGRITANGLAGVYSGFAISPTDFGGGIAVEGVAPQTYRTAVVIGSATCSDNYADTEGGGLWFAACELDCRNSRFERNGLSSSTASAPVTPVGGGIRGTGSVFRIEANTIIRNEAENAGAGVALASAGAGSTLTNNMIVKNVLRMSAGGGGGGGVHLDAAVPTFFHNTIAQNTIPGGGPGSGVFVASGAGLTIANCIVRGSGSGSLIDANGGAAPFVTHCNVGGSAAGNWIPGPNVFNLLPRFVDPTNDNFHIQPSSPCKDAGLVLPGLPSLDFDSQLRIQGVTVDIGADEVG